MRIVAGQARGRPLSAPPGRSTRPTSDRVREAIFAVLGSMAALDGARVADLFAGSGALGIEALSRGAAGATFVERDRRAVATIRANLAATGLGGPEVTVVQADAEHWLGRVRPAEPFDLVLCDPPYAYPAWPGLLAALVPVTRLAVIETGAPLELGPQWSVLKRKQYGGTVVSVARPASWPARPADQAGPEDQARRHDQKGGT